VSARVLINKHNVPHAHATLRGGRMLPRMADRQTRWPEIPDRPTDRQTDRPTDRPTDRLTVPRADLVDVVAEWVELSGASEHGVISIGLQVTRNICICTMLF
jgi:hypothetical protein